MAIRKLCSSCGKSASGPQVVDFGVMFFCSHNCYKEYMIQRGLAIWAEGAKTAAERDFVGFLSEGGDGR